MKTYLKIALFPAMIILIWLAWLVSFYLVAAILLAVLILLGYNSYKNNPLILTNGFYFQILFVVLGVIYFVILYLISPSSFGYDLICYLGIGKCNTLFAGLAPAAFLSPIIYTLGLYGTFLAVRDLYEKSYLAQPYEHQKVVKPTVGIILASVGLIIILLTLFFIVDLG